MMVHSGRKSTGFDTKPNAKEVHTCLHRSSNIALFHFSLLCMLQSTHQSRDTAQGTFIPKGATASQCIMVICLLERSWFRVLWDRKTRERSKEPYQIEANVSWAPWPTLVWRDEEERERLGCNRYVKWSAAKAEVTSAMRLHDATNAYQSMKHDVAKQAANEIETRHF